MSTTPLTREMIKDWGLHPEKLKKEIHDNPARLAEINAFLASSEYNSAPVEASEEVAPDPVVEEVAPDQVAVQAEADRVAADKARADAVRVAEAEQIAEAYRAAGVSIRYNPDGSIQKIIKEYQATDDAGNPIGNLTHLEARSWAEMALKEREAQVQITRAFHRLKNQKTTFKQKVQTAIPIPEVPLLSEMDRIQAALDLNSDDETVVVKADRKLRADQILREQRQQAISAEEARQKAATDEFKVIHDHDFYPCQANAKLMTEYLTSNNLVWTVDNLELAFAALGTQLVQKEVPVVEIPVPPVEANPPAAAAQVTQPTPVIQPVAAATTALEVPAAVVPAVNPVVTASRPGVNAGLVPGQMSAQRPVTGPVGLTMKEIWSWKPEELRKRLKNPAMNAEINKVIAAHNKAKASR